MKNLAAAKELGFIADLVGLINTHFDVLSLQTRSEMMTMAVDRIEDLRREMEGQEVRG